MGFTKRLWSGVKKNTKEICLPFDEKEYENEMMRISSSYELQREEKKLRVADKQLALHLTTFAGAAWLTAGHSLIATPVLARKIFLTELKLTHIRRVLAAKGIEPLPEDGDLIQAGVREVGNIALRGIVTTMSHGLLDLDLLPVGGNGTLVDAAADNQQGGGNQAHGSDTHKAPIKYAVKAAHRHTQGMVATAAHQAPVDDADSVYNPAVPSWVTQHNTLVYAQGAVPGDVIEVPPGLDLDGHYLPADEADVDPASTNAAVIGHSLLEMAVEHIVGALIHAVGTQIGDALANRILEQVTMAQLTALWLIELIAIVLVGSLAGLVLFPGWTAATTALWPGTLLQMLISSCGLATGIYIVLVNHKRKLWARPQKTWFGDDLLLRLHDKAAIALCTAAFMSVWLIHALLLVKNTFGSDTALLAAFVFVVSLWTGVKLKLRERQEELAVIRLFHSQLLVSVLRKALRLAYISFALFVRAAALNPRGEPAEKDATKVTALVALPMLGWFLWKELQTFKIGELKTVRTILNTGKRMAIGAFFHLLGSLLIASLHRPLLALLEQFGTREGKGYDVEVAAIAMVWLNLAMHLQWARRRRLPTLLAVRIKLRKGVWLTVDEAVAA